MEVEAPEPSLASVIESFPALVVEYSGLLGARVEGTGVTSTSQTFPDQPGAQEQAQSLSTRLPETVPPLEQ